MGLHLAGIYCMMVAASVSQAEQWQWPSDSVERSAGESRAAQSVRIDSKVRFEDSPATRAMHSDEAVFLPASDTTGFYNRPTAARTPVLNSAAAAESEGTLDAMQFCRCERAPSRGLHCAAGLRQNNGCGAHEHLCCYPSPQTFLHRTDVFNEIEDARSHDILREHSGTASTPVLVGPQGSTDVIGPLTNAKNDAGESESAQRGFFIPGRPSSFIGSGYERPILVGPGGPTGIVGPRGQGVLVGPGGPTGIIGPRRQGVLVGPGGPTGVIGPVGVNRGYGTTNRGVLVGPGGSTGVIGLGRRVLVGPGGLTGQVGPRGRFAE